MIILITRVKFIPAGATQIYTLFGYFRAVCSSVLECVHPHLANAEVSEIEMRRIEMGGEGCRVQEEYEGIDDGSGSGGRGGRGRREGEKREDGRGGEVGEGGRGGSHTPTITSRAMKCIACIPREVMCNEEVGEVEAEGRGKFKRRNVKSESYFGRVNFILKIAFYGANFLIGKLIIYYL